MYEITAVNTSPFNLSMLRSQNIWYTIADGNWSDPGIWISNGTKRHLLPQPGDDVVVNNELTYDNANNQTINNLFINGSLLWGSGLNQARLFINGNIQCIGTFDLSGSNGGGGAYVFINGTDNFFANFVTGNSTSNITINYTSPFNFAIPAVNYYNLQIGGGNTKSTAADLNASGLLTVDAGTTFELGSYNATVKDLSIGGTLSKNSSSGYFTVTNSNNSNLFGTVNFTGSPTINWSGNINSTDLRGGVNFGTGTFNILTNSNWSFYSAGNDPASIGACNFIIASGVTLTLTGAAAWLNNGTVNGVDGTSVLNISTSYCFGNSNPVMATGVFNYNFSGTSSIFSSGITSVPGLAYYNFNLYSGTATLIGDTTVSNILTIQGILQLSTFNFTSSGTTIFSGSILKSGSGTVNFNVLTNSNSTGSIDFSIGNPVVNISGDVSGDSRSGLNFGINPINIIQSITWGTWASGNTPLPTNISYLIASGKTLTNIGINNTTGGIQTTGTINGADNTAIFDNRSICNYQNPQQPMQTGKLYFNQATNTFDYQLSGNQDIGVPSDPTSPGYYNLTLSGSGSKTLVDNISVKDTYTLTSPATLNSNGFALTNP